MSDTFTCPYCGTPEQQERCETCHARPLPKFSCPECGSHDIFTDNKRLEDIISVTTGKYYENWKEQLWCQTCNHRWSHHFTGRSNHA